MFVERLVEPFRNDPSSYETAQRLYDEALSLAKELDLNEAQAATFAAWVSTLAGWSEPHPLYPPVRVAGLNRAFARAAWGPTEEELARIEDPQVREMVRRARLDEAAGYIPRLKDFFEVEGDYERGFEAVVSLIRKLLP